MFDVLGICSRLRGTVNISSHGEDHNEAISMALQRVTRECKKVSHSIYIYIYTYICCLATSVNFGCQA